MRALWCLILMLGACSNERAAPIISETPSPIQSGYDFLTPETQALQDDDFSNPGLLWVEKGASIFSKDCTGCHTVDSLKETATTFPKIQDSQLINLESRINLCRTNHMNTTPLPYESDSLLSLTTFITHQAKSRTRSVSITGEAAKHYNSGRDYFFTRRGQFNLSCAQCHNGYAGQKLRGDTISQGHSNGFPAYRFEWETLGSLHRRIADCDRGIRAEPHELGAQTYIDLELYLAARSQGLAMETPAVRR